MLSPRVGPIPSSGHPGLQQKPAPPTSITLTQQQLRPLLRQRRRPASLILEGYLGILRTITAVTTPAQAAIPTFFSGLLGSVRVYPRTTITIQSSGTSETFTNNSYTSVRIWDSFNNFVNYTNYTITPLDPNQYQAQPVSVGSYLGITLQPFRFDSGTSSTVVETSAVGFGTAPSIISDGFYLVGNNRGTITSFTTSASGDRVGRLIPGS